MKCRMQWKMQNAEGKVQNGNELANAMNCLTA